MKTLIVSILLVLFVSMAYAEDVLRYSPNNNEYSYASRTAVEKYNPNTNRHEWAE